MKELRQLEPNLHNPATYQIKVPGVLGEQWLVSEAEVTITIDMDREGKPTSIITSSLDQAALHGLLRRLYVYGLPLISVIWMKPD